MTSRLTFMALATVAALFTGPGAGHAKPTQPIGNAWQLCSAATTRTEIAEVIPARLLKAISLAETGRWDPDRQANFAWPWTVTALGQGNYFPGPDEALDFVRRLQSRGIRNIDVGCMQVNLFYHAAAFASLEDAIDPATNVAYAAGYLKGLYRSTRSWTQAAAYYHSTTPARARAYKLKVLKYWYGERRLAALVDPNDIDRARMMKLNTRFRERTRNAGIGAGQTQLEAWRNARAGGHDMATLATMRRAGREAEKRKRYLGDKSERTADILAAKRRAELDKWRRTWTTPGTSSGS